MKVKQQNLRSWLKHQPEYDSRTCQEKLLSATAQTPWNSETQHQHCARNPRQTTHRNDLPLRSLDPSPDTVVYEDGALARQWSEELIEHALRPDSPLLTHAYLLNPTAGNLDDAEKARDRRRKHFFKAKPKHCRDWSYDKKRPEEAGKKQEKCEEKQRRKHRVQDDDGHVVVVLVDDDDDDDDDDDNDDDDDYAEAFQASACYTTIRQGIL